MFDLTEKNAAHPNGKLRPCYLGKGLFDSECLKQLKRAEEEEQWFCSQIDLFIEYLNKIEYISYTDMARVLNVTIPMVQSLHIGLHNRAVLLVKYRDYIKKFERYYND